MAEINSKDVMKLRNQTGLPMMACKAALEKSGGDFEKAEELLRKELKGKMDTRTDRAAGEGRVAIALSADRSAAAIIEIRAETDFTAKSEKFDTMLKKGVGEVLAILRNGSADLAQFGAADRVELLLSDGVKSSRVRLDPVTGAIRP